jgi:hypothetical protein
MPTSNRLQNIVDRIETQLKWPNGSTPYNFEIKSVEQGFVTEEKANAFPHVCIPFASIGTNPVDQMASTQEVKVNVLGYVKSEKNTLRVALQLASDLENAIMADESLNGNVYSLTISTEVTTFADTSYGSVLLTISAIAYRTET